MFNYTAVYPRTTSKTFFKFVRWGFGLSEGVPLTFGVGNKGSERNLDPSLFGRR